MDNDNHKMTEAEYYRRAHWEMTQEAARLRAEVERLRSEKGNAVYWCGINERRAEDAEAKLRAVEALADEWHRLSGWPSNVAVPELRAALSEPATAPALDSHRTGTPEVDRQCPHEAVRATCPDPCGCSCGRRPCSTGTPEAGE